MPNIPPALSEQNEESEEQPLVLVVPPASVEDSKDTQHVGPVDAVLAEPPVDIHEPTHVKFVPMTAMDLDNGGESDA